jgi:copper chaperone CopZ
VRKLVGMFVVCLVGVSVSASDATAGKVEVKGPHICCKQCVNIVGGILGKVEGVTDAACSIQDKTVTFNAKDAAAAKAGFKALLDGGFFGTATDDGKELKVDAGSAPEGKADVVLVKAVHVCCGQCKTAVNKVFKDAKVSYEGKGKQLDVRIEGSGLDRVQVLDALRKAGFNGKVEK